MRTAYILSLMMSPLLIISSPNAREGGIKITGRTPPPKSTGRSYSGVQLGGLGRISNVTRQRSFPTTTTTTVAPTYGLPSKSPSPSSNHSTLVTNLKVGMMVPHKSFGTRDYIRAITTALNTLQRSTRGPRLGLFERYDLHVKLAMKELTPSPTISP